MKNENIYFTLKALSSANSIEIVHDCFLGSHFEIDVKSLKKVAFHNLNEFDLDVLLLIVAVDYADRRVKRHQATRWTRSIQLDIPVSEPFHWRQNRVISALTKSLNKLTGDDWQFSFHKRVTSFFGEQKFLPQSPNGQYLIIPYSDGMDSMLLGMNMPKKKQLRVTGWKRSFKASEKVQCVDGEWRISLPVRALFDSDDHPEGTYRTRSFKFLMLCALAAFWTDSRDVYLPENGQGILSPILTPKGVEFEYLGSHPIFTYELACFIKEAFGITIRFHHPNMWRTKGSVLKEAVNSGIPESIIQNSKSCALDARQGFGEKLHCGICTNCLLRRVSLFVAGFREKIGEYYYANLDGQSLEEMSDGKGPHREHKSHLDIAFHAIQSMERFANLSINKDNFEIEKHAYELSKIGFCSEELAISAMKSLVNAHRTEWHTFLSSLSPRAWINTKLKEIR